MRSNPGPEPRGSVLLTGGLAAPEARLLRDSPSNSGGRASVRQSGRYSTARFSRASVARASARGGRAAAANVFERILCIDEEGRDRTPRPLVAAQPHGAEPLGGWGSSEAPADTCPGSAGTADRASVLGAAPIAPFGGGLPSAHSFLMTNSDAGPSHEPSTADSVQSANLLGSRGTGAAKPSPAVSATAAPLQQQGPGASANVAAGARASQASPLTAALLEVGRVTDEQDSTASEHLQHAAQLRSKATQSTPVAVASRGVQVLPWELRSSNGGPPPGSQADGALTGLLTAAAGGTALAAESEGGGGGRDGEDEEEALQAMQQLMDPARQNASAMLRASPTPSRSGAQSQMASRRGSLAGAAMQGRISGMHDDTSCRGSISGSRRTSQAASLSDWSGRDSVVSSRASFAALLADGCSSIVGSVAGHYGTSRGSIMSSAGQVLQQQQQHRASVVVPAPGMPAAPQPAPAEAAAAAARREKAAQERALARLPGLLQKLQVAEKAVLLNLHHDKLAAFCDVQLCSAPQAGAGCQSQSSTAQERSATDHGGLSIDHVNAAGDAASAEPLQAAAVAAQASGTTRGSIAAQSSGSSMASLLGSSTQQLSKPPELPLLWTWQSELTGELPVSCLAWNKAAPGLLAVGYGLLEFEVVSTGLVAVWSLAHPSHPLWHATTPCGVSCLDWSGKAASSLAVGFFDGSVALYEVRNRTVGGNRSSGGHGSGGSGGRGNQPLARAPPAGTGGTGGHSDTVWRLRHVPRAANPGEEMLVSISTDGTLLEWKHAQGLECVELLRLRRQPSSAAATKRVHTAAQGTEGNGSTVDLKVHGTRGSREGYLGRAAGSTCLDFSPDDPRTYLVGTEDGSVHKCSTAFSEQTIQSYRGHLAPVYQVCWSPFSPTHFLTASADWSVRMWSEAEPRSIWTFQLPNARAEVADVAFSPAAATLFAAAAGNTLQLWDLEHSVLAPRAVATRLGVRLTALAFSQAAPVVVTGGANGVVSAYSIAAFYKDADEQEQRQRLDAALRQHTAQHFSSD